MNIQNSFQAMLRRRRKLASLAVYAIMTMVPRGANAIIAITYAAFLSPAALGIYGVCLAMQSMLAFFLDGGVSQAIVRTYYDHHNEPAVARAYLARMVVTSRAVSLLSSLVLLAAGYFAWKPLTAGQVPFWPIFPLVLFASFLERGGELLANICRALERPKMFAAGDSAQAVTLILAAIVLVVVLKLGILGAILALVAGSLARTIVFTYLLRRHENIKWALQLSSYAEFHEAVKFGMPIVANQVSTWGRQMGQRVVLLHVVPAAQVGVFFLAGSIANMLLVIVQAVSAVFDPLYYKRRVEDAEGFRQKVQIFTQIYFAILAMIVIPCILFVDEINHLLFKNKYENLGPAAAILLAASYARLQQPFISKQLLFQKKTLWIPLATLGPSLIALALTPVVAPQGGLAAVSWLAVAAVVASLVGLGTAVRRYEELDFPTGTAAALLFLVCLSAFWISIGAPGPDGHPVKILMKAVLAIAIVGICAFVWLWKNRSFLRTIARG